MMAGTIFGALAVILGAFGAHGLKDILPADQLAVFETGVRYQFYHSFALLASGLAFAYAPAVAIKRASNFFIIGTLLFSGSLYTMVMLSAQGISLGPVGIVTPIGGLLLIIGWVLFFVGVIKQKQA